MSLRMPSNANVLPDNHLRAVVFKVARAKRVHGMLPKVAFAWYKQPTAAYMLWSQVRAIGEGDRMHVQ